MTDHDELVDAIPALVLGSLTGDEHRQVRLHLESCASCREMAARLAKGAAALALEPDPVEPPARLRGRVLAAVAAASQEAPPKTRQRPLMWHRWAPGFGPGLRSQWRGLAAAAVCGLLVGGGLGIGLGQGRLPFGSQPAPSAEVARYSFHGTGDMAGVRANAVLLRQDGLALVDFRDLPQLTTDRVYELWLVTADGGAQPAAVFVPDAQGSRVVVVTRDVKDARQLAVTVEHGPNGSAVPSQQPQLSARFT